MHFRRVAASLTATAALAAAAFVYVSHPARSSDHQDSPAVVSKPGADITDVYLFPSPSNKNDVDLVMDVVPLIPAGMSADYSLDPSVLYQFKLAHGPMGTTAPADLAFQLTASGSGASQKVALYENKGSALTDPSTTGTLLGTFSFNRPGGTEVWGGVTAFAGPRADPFFFDLFQFFSILPDRYYKNPRTGDRLGSSTPTFNGFSSNATSGAASGNYHCSSKPSTNALTQLGGGFNVLSIVLEIPKRYLVAQGQSSLVHLWATASNASRQRIGGKVAYDQVELLSRPAVKELFEPFADHARTNVSQPYNDSHIKNAIAYFMANVAGRSAAITNVVTSVLYPNELAADLSQAGSAAYLGVETGGATGSKFGGRGLTDDVIDTSLGVVFGGTVPALGLTPDDGKENYCLSNEHVVSGQGGRQTQTGFPYVTAPH